MMRGVTEHPKFVHLKGILHLGKGATAGYLECMWHFCAKFTPRGNIGKYKDSAIEIWMEWDGEPGALIAALVEAGWLDVDDTHRLIVHDWCEHSDDAIDNQLARAIQTYACGCLPRMKRLSKDERSTIIAQFQVQSDAVRTESHKKPLPDPEPEPEPEPVDPPIAPQGASEKPKKEKPAKPDYKPSWAEFVAAYPKRDGDLGKAPGEKKFRELIESGQDPIPILEGVRRYREWADARGSTGSRFIKQIPSFLNGRTWQEPFDIKQQAGKPTIVARAEEITRGSLFVRQ